jgi:hypothetical protein
MSKEFRWSSKRTKAALALAEGQSQQAVAEAIRSLPQDDL